jgi:5-methylcytosine-specific restriction protein A
MPCRPSRPKSLCRSCKAIIDKPGYCEKCKPKHQRLMDQRRGSAAERGYNYQWSKESKAFKQQPENQFCYIRGPRCTEFVECPDHIIPPEGPNDPLFKDPNNKGPACNKCNTWKNHRSIQQLVKAEKEYYKSINYNPIEYLKERGLYY